MAFFDIDLLPIRLNEKPIEDIKFILLKGINLSSGNMRIYWMNETPLSPTSPPITVSEATPKQIWS